MIAHSEVKEAAAKEAAPQQQSIDRVQRMELISKTAADLEKLSRSREVSPEARDFRK
jgi:hypothetical protein